MADMDVNESSAETRTCFKCNYKLEENLNVVYDSTSSMIIFWNRFQLFLYENLNFEDATRIFVPEFVVHQILICNNYLICLDCSGNVHVTSLKFKNSAQKRLRTNFQPREQNILACTHEDEYVVSLKWESETYLICLNKISTEFQQKKSILIKYEGGNWPLTKTSQDKCLIISCKVPENDENIKEMFKSHEIVCKVYELLVITFDKLDIFACLISPNMTEKEIRLMKLYSFPSEICNMQIIEKEELNIIVVLASGTVFKLPLGKNSPAPVPIHLNSSVSKFITLKDNLIYTNGVSMWKSEETYTKIKFKELFLKHVKDFVLVGDQMICTTYSRLIYLIPVDDEKSYLVPEPQPPFYPVEELLNNSEYLYNVLEQVDKNKHLTVMVNEESNYITALALANRPDLMDNILHNTIVIYEHYEDAVKENPDVTLSEDLKEYFKMESLFLLVKVTILQMEHIVNEVLTQIFNNSRIHMSLFTENKLLKTNSVKIPKSLKKICILVPLDNKQISNPAEVKANIKIVTHIPGAYDPKEPVWTTLYHKEIKLNSEQFIKTHLNSSRNRSLKDPQETIEDLIIKAANNVYGQLFKFTDISKNMGKAAEFSSYVKLPTNYTETFQNQQLFNNRFNSRKAEYLSKQLTSEDFLKSKSSLIFEVGTFQVDVHIVMDEVSKPLLKVACEDPKTALSIRNFFADFIYNDFKLHEPGMEFVDIGFYAAAEDLQKTLKTITGPESMDLKLQKTLKGITNDKQLVEKFQKTIIGGLPI